MKSLSRVRLFATPWTAAYQAPVPGIFQARVLEWGAIVFSGRKDGGIANLILLCGGLERQRGKQKAYKVGRKDETLNHKSEQTSTQYVKASEERTPRW